MKLPKLKYVFGLVALLPLFYGAAIAGAQGGARADLKKVDLVEIADTPENHQKYPFLKDVLSDDAKLIQSSRPTRVLLGEVPAADAKDNMSFVYVDGAYYCGANNCQLSGFKGAGNNKVLDISAQETFYVQSCDNELSLIFPGGGVPDQVGKWVYNGTSFEFKQNYDGIDKVPVCK